MPLKPGLVEPATTAIVVSECQRSVVGDLSSLPQLAESAADAMKAIGRLVRAARPAGVQVVFCTVLGRPDGKGGNNNTRISGASRKAREQGVRLPDPVEAAQVVDVIGVEPEDIVLSRMAGMSPMNDSGLDSVLRNLGVRTMVATGVSLNIAVTNMVMDAVNAGYQVVVPRDAVAGVPREYGEAVLDNTLVNLARLTTVDELVGAWGR